MLAIGCVAVAACCSFLNPLVIRMTVDTLIGGKALDLPLGLETYLSDTSLMVLLSKHLWLAGLLIVVIGFIGHAFTYMRGKLSAIVSEELAKRMRDALYDHIQLLPYSWHSKIQAGDIIQRCSSDVDTGQIALT